MSDVYKKILQDGETFLRDLQKSVERKVEEAKEAVDKAVSDMASLSNFAESLPSKFLDRFTSISMARLLIPDGGDATVSDFRLECSWLGGFPVHPVSGPQSLKPGNYRAIVVLERIE